MRIGFWSQGKGRSCPPASRCCFQEHPSWQGHLRGCDWSRRGQWRWDLDQDCSDWLFFRPRSRSCLLPYWILQYHWQRWQCWLTALLEHRPSISLFWGGHPTDQNTCDNHTMAQICYHHLHSLCQLCHCHRLRRIQEQYPCMVKFDILDAMATIVVIIADCRVSP